MVPTNSRKREPASTGRAMRRTVGINLLFLSSMGGQPQVVAASSSHRAQPNVLLPGRKPHAQYVSVPAKHAFQSEQCHEGSTMSATKCIAHHHLIAISK